MKAKLTMQQYEMITSLGKKYIPELCPENVRKFDVGKCFDASMWNAIYHPEYKYVEGIVLIHGQLRWRLHAWLTDGVYAYDPTWKADNNGKDVPIPAEYIGIEMDTKDAAKFMRATGYQGVIANAWRDPALAETAIRSCL